MRNSNCKRQRCSLIFESAQTSSVPTSVRCARSFTGTSRSPDLPNRITAFSGACRCKSFAGSDGIAHLIVDARQRAVQTERDRLVGHQVQILAVEFEGLAFFGAARHQADGVASAPMPT